MMSRLLLLLCCATVLVLGTHGGSPTEFENSSVLKAVVQPKAPNQHANLVFLPDKSADSAHSTSLSLDKTIANDTKAHEDVTPQSEADEEHPKPKPITTAAPITSTTQIPTTSTTSAPTTTPAPPTTTVPSTTSAPVSTTPVPAPSAGKWIVNQTGNICIIAQMAVQFNISYMDTNKTQRFKVFDMPADNATTIATGFCGKLEQNITLQWPSGNGTIDAIDLHFIKNETTSRYTLHHLNVVLPATDFPDASITGNVTLVHETSSFSAGVSDSYRCVKEQRLSLKSMNSNRTDSYLTVSDLQFQAFKTDNSTVFGLATDCAFDTPDIVPIAVGCALAGLVVTVLIAYLVGRKRSQARGYLSM